MKWEDSHIHPLGLQGWGSMWSVQHSLPHHTQGLCALPLLGVVVCPSRRDVWSWGSSPHRSEHSSFHSNLRLTPQLSHGPELHEWWRTTFEIILTAAVPLSNINLVLPDLKNQVDKLFDIRDKNFGLQVNSRTPFFEEGNSLLADVNWYPCHALGLCFASITLKSPGFHRKAWILRERRRRRECAGCGRHLGHRNPPELPRLPGLPKEGSFSRRDARWSGQWPVSAEV